MIRVCHIMFFYIYHQHQRLPIPYIDPMGIWKMVFRQSHHFLGVYTCTDLYYPDHISRSCRRSSRIASLNAMPRWYKKMVRGILQTKILVGLGSRRIHVWYIFNCIWLISMVNVGNYTIHGWFGLYRLEHPNPPKMYLKHRLREVIFDV